MTDCTSPTDNGAAGWPSSSASWLPAQGRLGQVSNRAEASFFLASPACWLSMQCAHPHSFMRSIISSLKARLPRQSGPWLASEEAELRCSFGVTTSRLTDIAPSDGGWLPSGMIWVGSAWKPGSASIWSRRFEASAKATHSLLGSSVYGASLIHNPLFADFRTQQAPVAPAPGNDAFLVGREMTANGIDQDHRSTMRHRSTKR